MFLMGTFLLHAVGPEWIKTHNNSKRSINLAVALDTILALALIIGSSVLLAGHTPFGPSATIAISCINFACAFVESIPGSLMFIAFCVRKAKGSPNV